MERIITLFVNPKQVILANDTTLTADENGVIELRVDELLVSGEKGIQEYDRVVSDIISYGQRLSLYFMFLNSSRFGINDTVIMLGVERDVARYLLDLGMKHQLLKKIDTQKKLIPDVREQIRAYVNALKRIQTATAQGNKEMPKEVTPGEEPTPIEEPKKIILKNPLHVPKKKGK